MRRNLPNLFFLLNLLWSELRCGWRAVSCPRFKESSCSIINAGAFETGVKDRNSRRSDSSIDSISFGPPVSATAFGESLLILVRGRRAQRIRKMAERSLSFISQGSTFASMLEKNVGSQQVRRIWIQQSFLAAFTLRIMRTSWHLMTTSCYLSTIIHNKLHYIWYEFSWYPP